MPYRLTSFLILLTHVSLAGVLVLTSASEASAQGKLNRAAGFASRYPGDKGIAEDERVLFVEDFEESSVEAVGRRWETVRGESIMQLSNDVPDDSSGTQSLLMAQQADRGRGGDFYRRLGDGHDQVYTRTYVKFAEDCQPIHHFGTCVGGNNPSTAWPSVRAGHPTQGDRSFWIGIEPYGKAWRWDYYAYWCDMQGSPPRGQTWGNSFIQDDSLKVKRGEWTCIEVMTKMNNVGDTNGELALWIDGQQVSHLGKGFPRGKWTFDKLHPGQSGQGVRWNHDIGDREYFETAPGGDPFEGFRFRTVDALNVDFVWLYVYITKGTPGHTNRVWFDDFVVATEYIGPLHPTD